MLHVIYEFKPSKLRITHFTLVDGWKFFCVLLWLPFVIGKNNTTISKLGAKINFFLCLSSANETTIYNYVLIDST